MFFRKRYLIAVVLACSMLSVMYNAIHTTKATKPAEKTKQEEGEICLSNYHHKVVFGNPEDVRRIAEKYGLEDPDEIEEIVYIPIGE
ncbi:MAG: hypothetical protein K6G65_04630 [Lachnospiraceae bacterium]|nr:hypothetical protein [Lachnospiraceae bacterium]